MKKIIILLTIITISVFAHRINLFTDYDGKNLYISSYFPNGDPCINCDVKIFSNEKLLKSLKTNNSGEINISIDKKDLKVEVDASMGHKVIKNIVATSNIIKSSEEKKDLESKQLEQLKQENKRLKLKIKTLEEKLSLVNIIKMIFALFVIIGIFMFLKRVKK